MLDIEMDIGCLNPIQYTVFCWGFDDQLPFFEWQTQYFPQ
jgi:hypothetical protein